MLFTPYDCYERIDAYGLTQDYIELDHLPREGWKIRGIPSPESVATHSFWNIFLIKRFQKELRWIWADIDIMCDTMLVHDIQEKEKWVWDITPFSGVSPEEKKKREIEAVERILWKQPRLLALWYDYTDVRTLEWRLCKEIDKLDSIEVARLYEIKYGISHPNETRWLFDAFYTMAVIQKKQIQTDFLLRHATHLYENKPR